MNPISPKAVAGAGGAGLGSSLVTVLIWAFHLSPPPDVVAALTVVISTLVSFGVAYITPHSSASSTSNGSPSPDAQSLAARVPGP